MRARHARVAQLVKFGHRPYNVTSCLVAVASYFGCMSNRILAVMIPLSVAFSGVLVSVADAMPYGKG